MKVLKVQHDWLSAASWSVFTITWTHNNSPHSGHTIHKDLHILQKVLSIMDGLQRVSN